MTPHYRCGVIWILSNLRSARVLVLTETHTRNHYPSAYKCHRTPAFALQYLYSKTFLRVRHTKRIESIRYPARCKNSTLSETNSVHEKREITQSQNGTLRKTYRCKRRNLSNTRPERKPHETVRNNATALRHDLRPESNLRCRSELG